MHIRRTSRQSPRLPLGCRNATGRLPPGIYLVTSPFISPFILPIIYPVTSPVIYPVTSPVIYPVISPG